MEIPAPPDLTVEVGPDGFAVQLSHPLVPAVGNPLEHVRHVALAYLSELAQAKYLPVNSADLEHLRKTIHAERVEASVHPRLFWLPDRQIIRNGKLEGTIILIQQSIWWHQPIPIEGCGIRILCQHYNQGTVLVTGATSTLLDHANLSEAAQQVSAEWFSFDRSLLNSRLALAFGVDETALNNAQIQFVAFNPNDDRSLTGRRVDDAMPGELTIGYRVECNHALRPDDPVAFRAFYDLANGRASTRHLLASACSGLSFSSDPVSKSGSAGRRPNSFSDRLDPLRDACQLHNLDTILGGQHSLSGPRVAIKVPNPLGFVPPTATSTFNFLARTNEFAAVSAYAHCDAMMHMVEEFGFDLTTYFPALPIRVVHRAALRLTAAAHDGKAVAAFVQAVRDNPGPNGLEMCFALADLSDPSRNPLGVAADIRWVWHEFAHVLLAASTGELEFRFAHSAGDALAAIMCDADSHLVWDMSPRGWRGLTFPFVASPLRRHDRTVVDGWGWSGSLYEQPPHYPSARDPAGYRGEQLISSTLFRLYRASGGDAFLSDGRPHRSRRRAAAQYVAYLLVRAIHSLGPASTTPAKNANVLAASLIDADVGTRKFGRGRASRLGGSLHKVIRWAFQQQGLYHSTATVDQNTPGDPPAVDIYVERIGTAPDDYSYNREWRSKPTAVWVRNAADGLAGDEVPRTGAANFIYVEVGNQGLKDARDVSVDVLTRSGPGHDIWEASGEWKIVPPNTSAVIVADIAQGTRARFGPFLWEPKTKGKHGLFVRSTTRGDRSNADANSSLACAAGPINMQFLVPFDNNLGYRSWLLS